MGSGSCAVSSSYKKASVDVGHRNCNNIFNPCYMEKPEYCEDVCCEKDEHRVITLKLFPSNEQFEMIKLYYLDPGVEMSISSMFELTDEQFKELYKLHMKRASLRNCETKSQYIYRIRDFYRAFYRDTDEQRQVLIDMLKTLDVDVDSSVHSSDMYDLKHRGHTETQDAWVNLFRVLLDYATGFTEEERINKRMQYYEDILIPKYMDLEEREMVGKRWWLLFEQEFEDFPTSFVLKYLNRFSGRFLLSKRMQYKEIAENPEVKDLIIKRLAENIKDELGIYNVNDGLIDVSVNFDLDQVSLFKYLEETERKRDYCEGY